MITRYLTSVSASFSPFSPRSGKTARLFLATLGANARSSGMKIDVKMLPRAQAGQAGSLKLGFKDGKTMDIDLETANVTSIIVDVDRHSRSLIRAEEIGG